MRRSLAWIGLALCAAVGIGCGSRSSTRIAQQVAVGEDFACVRMRDGMVRCWGRRASGRLGDGVQHGVGPLKFLQRLVPASHAWGAPPKPELVVAIDNVDEVAAGRNHACARRQDGAVWCWGDDSRGQLAREKGDSEGAGDYVPYPVRVPGLPAATQLTAGDHHSCARTGDGKVWCWGEPVDRPERESGSHGLRAMDGLNGVLEVRAAGDNACALTGESTVRCWGANRKGQLGDGTAMQQVTVPRPTRVADVKGAVEVAVGRGHSCARLGNGDLRCWGREASGHKKLAAGVVPKLVAAGEDTTCMLAPDATLTCWGDSEFAATTSTQKAAVDSASVVVGKPAGAVMIAVGTRHVCALIDNGTVTCWGASFRDAGDTPTRDAKGPFAVEGLGKAVHLASGSTRTCAVGADGQVRCWGVARKLETMEGLRDAVQVAVGEKHTCVRRKSGPVACWGDDELGQLGRGTTDKNGSRIPADVPGTEDAVQVVAASGSTCARLKDGSVRCWGSNSSGQLGLGTFSTAGPESLRSRAAVAAIPGQAVGLAAGNGRFCALLADGEVACWGNGEWGSCTGVKPEEELIRKPPAAVQGLRDVAQIAVAATHSCALRKDGSVVCWGSNESGQMGDGTQGKGNVRTTPVAIAALAGATRVVVGPGVTCGSLPSGRFWCFGAMKATGWEVPGAHAATSLGFSGYGESESDGRKDAPGCAVMPNGALACWGSRALGGSDRDVTPVQVRW